MSATQQDSFQTHRDLTVGGHTYRMVSLPAFAERTKRDVARLPVSLRVLLENLLRREDGRTVRKADIEAIAAWDPKAAPSAEIAFMPARVLLQDFTGVPAVVDLAAMRDATAARGVDPQRINPQVPVDLVIDHSVQVDAFGSPDAYAVNVAREYERNRERYEFLRWGATAFENFRVVPPGTGIVHQINLEYLASTVFSQQTGDTTWAYPDTVVGTDSHTTMINGLGVLGWGVGGIEAEAAMLGRPISMLVPQVVGFRLTGSLPAGATATDAVLTVTEQLRKVGVVGKFVEFFGPGMKHLTLADRATLANMAPEYGATMGFFPIDEKTIEYLRFSGRDEAQVELVEAYTRAQGMFGGTAERDPEFTQVVELDLGTVVPSLAGPRRPQDRVALTDVKASYRQTRDQIVGGTSGGGVATATAVETSLGTITHGAVVIAAITSCTNTSNPSVMVAAGLVAQKAAARGLRAKPWVKTSLAPGSKVVTDYLNDAGLLGALNEVGFALVGYGCTTCIGNSGPLPEEISAAVKEADLVVSSVLSGNRNFEGRVNPQTKVNYLASPPLVVAYALAGTMDLDLTREPLGVDAKGAPVMLADIWPTPAEVEAAVRRGVKREQFESEYATVFDGDEQWRGLPVPKGDRFEWQPDSTYVRFPAFLEDVAAEPTPPGDIVGARALAVLGDSVTTDHISPAGSIPKDGPAGRWLQEQGVAPQDFNSFGSRRGNHEVMVRGTFANIRLRNSMAPGTEGGWTKHPDVKEPLSIYDASLRYQKAGTPLVVLAGKDYGMGSSRDWAAKGTTLLGVRAVIATSYERIHRSNLIGMGILPLEFENGQGAGDLGLDGTETFDIRGIGAELAPGLVVQVAATRVDGSKATFQAKVRIDTPDELDYYRHGGILPYVLRQLWK
ncbi:MAG: aconitate hydratase AcnA [Planctomycetota bacterium]|nr:aconitate hydratase AcnA [Planctomycetota bacterium]